MKFKYYNIVGCVIILVNITGCALIKKPVEFVDNVIGKTLFPPYSGPKAKITLADVEIKSAKATPEVGIGLHDMLSAALNNTNRFLVINPNEEKVDKLEGLIVVIEVSDFKPQAQGGSAGMGGGGSASSGTLGSLLGTDLNKAYIALNIRIVDAASSMVLASGNVSGQAVKINKGVHKKQSKNKVLSPALSMYSNTSMEEAIHNCILEAVGFIVPRVPSVYYKGGVKNGKKKT